MPAGTRVSAIALETGWLPALLRGSEPDFRTRIPPAKGFRFYQWLHIEPGVTSAKKLGFHRLISTWIRTSSSTGVESKEPYALRLRRAAALPSRLRAARCADPVADDHIIAMVIVHRHDFSIPRRETPGLCLNLVPPFDLPDGPVCARRLLASNGPALVSH
jgi:hypothetical protein